METASLSSFILGILTAFFLLVLLMNSLHWRKSETFHESASQYDVQDQRLPMDVAEQLNMSREELREELKRGKSMMEIARERGKELHLPPRWIDETEKQRFLQGMAERMGISIEELGEELSTGKRLMDIAKEHGITPRFQDSEEREPLPRW